MGQIGELDSVVCTTLPVFGMRFDAEDRDLSATGSVGPEQATGGRLAILQVRLPYLETVVLAQRFDIVRGETRVTRVVPQVGEYFNEFLEESLLRSTELALIGPAGEIIPKILHLWNTHANSIHQKPPLQVPVEVDRLGHFAFLEVLRGLVEHAQRFLGHCIRGNEHPGLKQDVTVFEQPNGIVLSICTSQGDAFLHIKVRIVFFDNCSIHTLVLSALGSPTLDPFGLWTFYWVSGHPRDSGLWPLMLC